MEPQSSKWMQERPPGDQVSVEITVNGPVQVSVDGRNVPLTHGERVVLAALCLDVVHGIDVDTLIGLRWVDSPPTSARQSLHNTISHLRRKTGLAVPLSSGRYHLGVAVRTDADRIGEGRMALPNERAWFADLPVGPMVRRAAAALDRQVSAAARERIACLELDGDFAGALALAHGIRVLEPSDEANWVKEISLLLSLGRRLDAAITYREARRVMRRSFGVDPGNGLRRVEALIWSDTTTPTGRDLATSIIGRAELSATVRRYLTGGHTVLLSGLGWSGKTALAAHLAQHWPVSAIVIDCGRSRRTPLASICDLIGDLPDHLRHAVDTLTVDASAVAELTALTVTRLTEHTLLVLDDVDRLAPLSRAVLAVALRVSDARVLATSRHTAVAIPGRDDIVHEALRPLTVHQIACLVRADVRTSAVIDQLTGGSPGLALLLVDAAGRLGLPLSALEGLVHAERVPPLIADAVLGRVAGVSTSAKATLEMLALTPEAVALSDLQLLEPSARDLVRVDGDGHARLCHPLLTRILAEQVPAGLRAEAWMLQAALPRSGEAPLPLSA